VYDIALGQLEEALENMNYRKASGPNRVNSELIKHGGIKLKLQVLHLSNMR
jgi:hypothetical protein